MSFPPPPRLPPRRPVRPQQQKRQRNGVLTLDYVPPAPSQLEMNGNTDRRRNTVVTNSLTDLIDLTDLNSDGMDVLTMFDPLVQQLPSSSSSNSNSNSPASDSTADKSPPHVINDNNISDPSPGNQFVQPSSHQTNSKTAVMWSPRSCDRIEQFAAQLKSVRREFNHTREESNSGIVYSPILERRATGRIEVDVIVHSNILNRPDQIVMTCDISTSIDHIISHVLCSLLDDFSNVNLSAYMLCVFLREEFLQPSTLLSDYAYVHSCLKFQRKILLSIVETEKIKRTFARTREDDVEMEKIGTESLLPVEFANRFSDVNYHAITILMEVLDREIKKVMDCCRRDAPIKYHQTRQAVQAIAAKCGKVETEPLRLSLEDLTSRIKSMSETNSRSPAVDLIESAVKKLYEAVTGIIDLYSSTFPVDFTIRNATTVTEHEHSKPASDCQEELICWVGQMSQPDLDWSDNYNRFYVQVELWSGEQRLASTRTQHQYMSESFLKFPRLQFEEWVSFEGIPMNTLPRETCIVFSLYGYRSGERATSPVSPSHEVSSRLAFSMVPMFGDDRRLVQGNLLLPMWQSSDTLSGSWCGMSSLSSPNFDADAALLTVSFPEFEYDVVIAPRNVTSVSAVAEWSVSDALKLLSSGNSDIEIRKRAVQRVACLKADSLFDILPQLVQALRYEQRLDSPLIFCLLEASLKSVRVAHRVYWLLKENTTDPFLKFRYLIFQNALLLCCGKQLRQEFEKEEELFSLLDEANSLMKSTKENSRLSLLRDKLQFVNAFICHQENGLALPFSISNRVRGLVVSECSYFPSNTLPLKLVFNINGLENKTEAIYKAGDDLRQDMLTMQIIRMMEKLWLKEGLDLRILSFECLQTDRRKGFVEMIRNAATLRKIQQKQGLAGTFNEKSIVEWLMKFNSNELEFVNAVENFTKSCAGYVVATYILGICDRHNDNIMITTSGHLFHIDFGKFLGDAQMFGSIRRDRVPFVFTPDMAYVISYGSADCEKMQSFVTLCCQAFEIIRKESAALFPLLDLMNSAGIPGVTRESIRYVHSTLLPDMSPRDAEDTFSQMIIESLKNRTVQINFFVHSLGQISMRKSELKNQKMRRHRSKDRPPNN